ncbi:MAG: Hint domain-containing protein [Firmicutes bacterium]|jgi:hypothetical protein|nr:Hint domain-containing protein [Bacillota bacterium]
MFNCVPEDCSTILLRTAGEVLYVKFSFLNDLIEGRADSGKLEDLQILGRTGWTQIISVSRRKLWEGEPLFHVSTRSGKLSLTGEHRVALRRGGREVVLPVREIGAGDALLARPPSKIRGGKPVLDAGAPLQAVGILSMERATGYTGYVYELETGDHWFFANDFLVHDLCYNQD